MTVPDANMELNEPHLTLRDGTPVLIRRLLAEDAVLYPDFLSDVTARTCGCAIGYSFW
jgi:hypothetical protein